MRVLICGARGQLGSDCEQVLHDDHEITALGSRDLDITRPDTVRQVLEEDRPEVVLNCAAYTKVDECEREEALAFAINADGPKNLAAAAESIRARLIHISTDYVFDGRKRPPQPYTEDDDPAPQSVYGRSKLAGEAAVQETCADHVILRTAWLYGKKGQNFLKTMLRLTSADPKREIRVVDDQHGSPTWSYCLALQIKAVLESPLRGLYHATAEGYCTWYELATRFLQEMGQPHHIVPCSTEEYPTPAVRPRNSILENVRLKATGKNVMRPWDQDLKDFVALCGKDLVREMKGEI